MSRKDTQQSEFLKNTYEAITQTSNSNIRNAVGKTGKLAAFTSMDVVKNGAQVAAVATGMLKTFIVGLFRQWAGMRQKNSEPSAVENFFEDIASGLDGIEGRLMKNMMKNREDTIHHLYKRRSIFAPDPNPEPTSWQQVSPQEQGYNRVG